LRNAILAEFQGRTPTLQEIFSIPSGKWLTVPGMGPTLLVELEAIMQDHQDKLKVHAPARLTEAQFLDRIERMQHDLDKLRHDFLVLIRERKRRDRDISPDNSDLH
jgi:hypothetical protein